MSMNLSEIACSECRQGKHQNCTIEILIGNRVGDCLCTDAAHAEGGS